jgi:hypothetical protein
MRMRDVVDVVTSDPPPLRYGVDEIVASGERAARRRRLGRAAAGAAAVVVTLGVGAAVAVPWLSSPQPDARENAAAPDVVAAAGPVAPFTFTVGTYTVGKLTVAAPIDVSTAYELAPVYAEGLVTNDRPVAGNDSPSSGDPEADKANAAPANDLYAYLAVYRPGAYDASKLANAQKVTVGSAPGLETTVTGGAWPMARTLAWQYADNAWAVIQSLSSKADYPSADDLRKLAAGLRTGARTPAKVPIAMSYVPAGYALDEVGVKAMPGMDGIASAREGDYGGLLFSRPAQPTTGLTAPFGSDGEDPPGSFKIFIVPSANSNQPTATPSVTCLVGFCNRYFDDGRVQVQVSSGGRLTNDEMKRILAGITLADVQNQGTWAAPPA